MGVKTKLADDLQSMYIYLMPEQTSEIVGTESFNSGGVVYAFSIKQ